MQVSFRRIALVYNIYRTQIHTELCGYAKGELIFVQALRKASLLVVWLAEWCPDVTGIVSLLPVQLALLE